MAILQFPPTNIPPIDPNTGQYNATWIDWFNRLILALQGSSGGNLSSATITLASTSNVILSNSQASATLLELTGTLTTDVTIQVPNAFHSWIVHNGTTGNYTVTLQTAAGTGVQVNQTFRAFIYCDAVNVEWATEAVAG